MIENKNEQIQDLTSAKIAAHKKVLNQLGLVIKETGNEMALLIEDLAEKNPDGWEKDLDKIILETQRIEKEKSLPEAMFYLADIVGEIDKRKLTEMLTNDKKRLSAVLRVVDLFRENVRAIWDPNKRSIPLRVDNALTPAWWDRLEIEYEGRLDEYLTQVDSTKDDVAKKVGEVVG